MITTYIRPEPKVSTHDITPEPETAAGYRSTAEWCLRQANIAPWAAKDAWYQMAHENTMKAEEMEKGND